MGKGILTTATYQLSCLCDRNWVEFQAGTLSRSPSFLTLAQQRIPQKQLPLWRWRCSCWAAYLSRGARNRLTVFKKRPPCLFAWEKRIWAFAQEKVTAHQSLPRWPLRRTKGSWFFKSRVCKLGVTTTGISLGRTFFFFFFFLIDKLGSIFISDSRHFCRSLFSDFPYPLPFYSHFSQLATIPHSPPSPHLVSWCVICLQLGCLFDLPGFFSAEL